MNFKRKCNLCKKEVTTTLKGYKRYLFIALGYCESCAKAYNKMNEPTEEEVIDKAKQYPKQLKKALGKKRKKLIKQLKIEGLEEEEINSALEQFDKLKSGGKDKEN